MKKNQIYLLLSIAILAAMSIVLLSLNNTKSEKVVINTPKIKELIKKNPTIVFNENKLLFVSRDTNYKEHFDTLNLKVNNQYKDVLFLDTTGYLYVTNDLRLKENVFTPKCKTGLADADGNLLLKPIYDKIYVFDQTIKDLVIIEKDNKLGLADKDGKIIAETIYQNIYPDFTKSGLIAILEKGMNYYGLDKEYKINKLKSSDNKFKIEFDNFSFINVSSQDKLLGYSLFEVQNEKYIFQNIYDFNKVKYNLWDSLINESRKFKLDLFVSYEPHFKKIKDSLETFYAHNANHENSGFESTRMIDELYSLGNKLWAFVLSVHETGDRGYDHNINKLIIIDNKLNTIDNKILVENVKGESKFEYYDNNIYRVEEYMYDSERIEKQILYKDTGEVIIKSNFVDNNQGDNTTYYSAFTLNTYYSINGYGKICELNQNIYSRKKYLFTKFTKLRDSHFILPSNYVEFPDGNSFQTRKMNSLELQEMLDEIINDYKDKDGKIPNNVESKMTEIDQYNIKFIRNKMNQLSANIKK